MLPYLACYMGHADLRGTQYYLRLTADAYPQGDGQGPGPVRLRHPRTTRGRAVNPRPAPPPELAGRWLSKFFTGHLARERAASPKTMSSYRDAMKLLLTWFRDAEHIPPEKLRLADIDRPQVLRFLDWLEAERSCSASTLRVPKTSVSWADGL
jgi:hypothetical protein